MIYPLDGYPSTLDITDSCENSFKCSDQVAHVGVHQGVEDREGELRLQPGAAVPVRHVAPGEGAALELLEHLSRFSQLPQWRCQLPIVSVA